jgi:putative ABC transport system permease protein
VKDAGSAGGYRRSRLRDGLVVAQMAASLFLLSGAALALRAVYAAQDADAGFDAAHVLVIQAELASHEQQEEYSARFVTEGAERIRALPGVRSVSAAAGIVMSGGMVRRSVAVPGRQRPPGEDPQVSFAHVWPDYFETLALPLVRGRGIGGADVKGAAPVVVVNEAMARQYWPGGNAVGERLQVGDALHEVVGVAANAAYSGPTVESRPALLRLRAAVGLAGHRALRAHRGRSALLAPAARGGARPGAGVAPTRTSPCRRSTTCARHDDAERGDGGVHVGVRHARVVLAAVGLYGVTSYVVARAHARDRHAHGARRRGRAGGAPGHARTMRSPCSAAASVCRSRRALSSP